MKINFKKRTMTNMGTHKVIRYGVSTEEMNNPAWQDVPANYEELGYGGKKPEDKIKKHYFNQREKDLQSDRDETSFRAYDTERRTEDARYVKAVEGSLGGNHRRGRVT